MKKTDLKSFDIATYDVEIEFNKKIAPFQKKIDKLDQAHETKSLKAHKDFLTKEKSSKSNITQIDEKHILKLQRIKRAAENKLVKVRKKDQNIKEEFTEFKKIQNIALQEELEVIKLRVLELNELEEADKLIITNKYKNNVESYVEKLDTYNSNFENNKVIFNNQYAKYRKILNDSLEKIDQVKKESDEIIQNRLTEYLELKQKEDNESNQSFGEVERVLNKDVINLRKNSNKKAIAAKEYIDTLRQSYEKRYNKQINTLKDTVTQLTQELEARKVLIEKDLAINLEKIEAEIEAIGDKKTGKVLKSIEKKRDLFVMRAKTILNYEEHIQAEKVSQLEVQIAKYEEDLKNELLNLDKLAVFLMNDQNQLKDTGEYFKTLNLELKSELVKSETANNGYLVKHEKLKTEYVNNYTKLFNDIKKRLIDANESQIDQLTTINAELDDIDKFLDTVEPLKEIELNKLRESVETSEVSERYKIKYSKQEHEEQLITSNHKVTVALEELNNKILLSENNKDITEIKNKETMDYSIEAAKLKYNKANEILKLRLNRTKLERNILKSSYETELQKADINKELVAITTEKNNIILTKDIEAHIENIKLESKYKLEVVNKRLEEDILKLEENVNKISYERDSFIASIDQMNKKEEQSVDREIVQINNQMDSKLALIDEALAREIKEPSLNIARSEVIIKERMDKFTQNDIAFKEFMTSSTDIQEDENLTVDQLKTVIVKNKSVFDRVNKYVDNTYECLLEAINFMKDLEQRSLLNTIAATADQSKTKKLTKQKAKLDLERKKQLQSINASKEDHKTRLSTILKGNMQRLQKLKNLEFAGLKEQVDTIYSNLYNHLSSLQENIVKEVQQLYSPLTSKDQEILDNANKNAVKARNLVEKDREKLIEPINTRLGEFFKEKEEEKHRVVSEYNTEIQELTNAIEAFKRDADLKTKDIIQDEKDLIGIQMEQLSSITDNKEANIDKQIADIANHKMRLEHSYVAQLESLDEKDNEAKKIFEYEERIYNIALETAQSRYNDVTIKTNKAHELNLVEAEENKLIIQNNAEKHIDRINKNLLDATNEFEKNIFTTRPKFEESIGDAQRAIEAEQKVKEARKIELLNLNNKRTEAIEHGLYTSFKDAYEKLEQNLNYYLEKYKIIEEEYSNSIASANEVIKSNFDVFKNALFELGEAKIKKTSEELATINSNIQ